MELWRGEEGQVVAAVVHQHVDSGQEDPQPDGGRVGAQQDGTHHDGHHVDKEVLHGMGVGSGDGDGTLPLMMLLVDVLVEEAVVAQSVGGNTSIPSYRVDA